MHHSRTAEESFPEKGPTLAEKEKDVVREIFHLHASTQCGVIKALTQRVSSCMNAESKNSCTGSCE